VVGVLTTGCLANSCGCCVVDGPPSVLELDAFAASSSELSSDEHAVAIIATAAQTATN